MFLVLLVAPAVAGITRKVKARLTRREGPPLIQCYRDLLKLIRKDSVLADNASWFFRSAPYAIFAFTWVAAALVPTFASGLMFNWAADIVALVALIGAARALLALAAMDVGTSFGGLGSSREMMIASLAEPATLLVALTTALAARHNAAAGSGAIPHQPAVRNPYFLCAGLCGPGHGGHCRECPHSRRQPGDAS